MKGTGVMNLRSIMGVIVENRFGSYSKLNPTAYLYSENFLFYHVSTITLVLI